MVKAQQWLDSEYPKEDRKNITKLDISSTKKQKKNLEGHLDLRDFENLKELNCFRNQLTSLNLNNCPNLEKINCRKNGLTDLDLSNCPKVTSLNFSKNKLTNLNFLSTLNNDELEKLDITKNSFPTNNLVSFSRLTNLKQLELSSNNFSGSLEPLKYLTKLEKLNIGGTNIENGLEYLPDTIQNFRCLVTKNNSNLVVQELKKLGKPIKGNFSPLLKLWKKTNSELVEKTKENANIFEIETDYTCKNTDELVTKQSLSVVNAQQWLDTNYPKEKRVSIKELNINDQKLKGKLKVEGFVNLEKFTTGKKNKLTALDLSGAPNLKELDCSFVYSLNSLNLSKNNKLVKLKCINSQLINLDLSGCDNLEQLDSINNRLTNVNLKGNVSLRKINFTNNQLTDLDLSDCSSLSTLCCPDNKINNVHFLSSLPNPENLEKLSLLNNNFPEQDLSFLEPFTNLKEIRIGNMEMEGRKSTKMHNRFYGSLEYLQNLSKLEKISIANTNIDSGLEYLPDSLKFIHCSADYLENCNVKKIHEELEDFVINSAKGHYNLKDWKENRSRKTEKFFGEDKDAKKNACLLLSNLPLNLDFDEKKQLSEKSQVAVEPVGIGQKELSIELDENLRGGKLAENELFFSYEQLKEVINIVMPEGRKLDFATFKEEVKRLKIQDLTFQLQISKNKLNELVDSAKRKIDEDLQDYLDILLEAQAENSENNNFVVRQMERAKNKLSKKLNEQELQTLLIKQKEVGSLEKQLENLQTPEQKYETQIEVWTKK